MLEENFWPSDAVLQPQLPAAGKQQIKLQHKDSGQAANPASAPRASPREFGTPVDGSPVAGIAPSGSSVPIDLQRLQQLPFGRLEQRRKRDAAAADVYVDDDFRECPQPVPQCISEPLPLQPAGLGVEALRQQQLLLLSRPSLPSSPEPVPMDEDQENRPPLPWVARPVLAARPVGTFDYLLPGQWSEQRRPLRERVLQELPVAVLEEEVLREIRMEASDELQEDVLRESRMEASDELQDDSPDGDDCASLSDFESEDLAEILERRIWSNAEGRYDFEIFVDPENR